MVSRLIFSAAILFSVFSFAQNTVLMGGKPVHTYSKLPAVNKAAPRFILTDVTMKDQTLDSYKGKYVILNIFPSVDTGVCSASVHHFNEDAGNIPNTVVLCISKDLPFAQKRFCGAEGIKNVVMLSDFRSDFGKTYGVEITDSVMKGLLSRAVVVIDPSGKIIYEEQVADISHEPNYEAAIAAVKK
ncbi:thiol peroxidase (atypical 2-Cys peroxiredoxin) [Chryseobacterium oranimense]|uniref:Thiol peroxidase n=1 Tax=Chryseobacterium oranimense TaxID=421058 RepID=A0A1M5JUM6_9FLAO|nr:thiol peroxidase [Chryseobacterium oranimense]SHG44312.1 thiol peroxidase (atypical 2-Cys peroxiredoxin) [Chryseobacterium oranimense]